MLKNLVHPAQYIKELTLKKGVLGLNLDNNNRPYASPQVTDRGWKSRYYTNT